jgi:hydrophobic/amphiphilic exporter-1 (mainly G- bacteria), HAE1 family
MTALVSWCLRRRSVVILATLLILAAGALGATQLRQQFFPDVDFPFVITNLEVQGLDAEAVDEQVAQPLEEAARNLEDVETTQTLASEGRVTLVTELSYGTDTSQFEEDLARELAGIELPEAAGEPEIGGGFDEQAALNAALSTTGSLTGLTDDAERVRDDLERIDGVGRVELDGGVEEEYAVELKRGAVRRGQTPGALAAQIQASLREAPVGLVEKRGSRTPLLVDPGTVDNERELEQLPISNTRELGDVATVRRQRAAGTGFARTNGRPSIAMSIYTEDDADQVQVVEDAQATLARADDRLRGVEVDTIFETASDVRASVKGLLL